MNCYWCSSKLIWGGDEDIDKSMPDLYPEYSIKTNLHCSQCGSDYQILKKNDQTT